MARDQRRLHDEQQHPRRKERRMQQSDDGREWTAAYGRGAAEVGTQVVGAGEADEDRLAIAIAIPL